MVLSQLFQFQEIIHIKKIYSYLGYVSQANENDISTNEVIKEKFVQGLKSRKNRFRKIF